jgi:hypothetical protein
VDLEEDGSDPLGRCGERGCERVGLGVEGKLNIKKKKQYKNLMQ